MIVMGPFNILLVGALAAINNNNDTNPSSRRILDPAAVVKPPIQLEVCLSPGCVADGSLKTIKKCIALAPPNTFIIQKGGCVSACGNGPVIREDEKFIHKRVKDVLPLMEELISKNSSSSNIRNLKRDDNDNEDDDDDDGESMIPRDLIDGYEIAMNAETSFQKSDYEEAIILYQKGIDTAIECALEISKEYNNNNDTNGDNRKDIEVKDTPPNLEWIVDAYCDLSTAQMHIKDYVGSLDAATNACSLSRESDPKCLELLAQIYQLRNESEQERKALTKLFAITVEGELPRDVSNRRRSQRFRLEKLQRENP